MLSWSLKLKRLILLKEVFLNVTFIKVKVLIIFILVLATIICVCLFIYIYNICLFVYILCINAQLVDIEKPNLDYIYLY